MNYTVQFQTLPAEPRKDAKVCRAHAIPRIGETLDLDGSEFTVIAVFHSAELIRFDSAEVEPLYDSNGDSITVRVR